MVPNPSIEDAVGILRDTDNSELRREEAAEFLAAHPEPVSIQTLVDVLEDRDGGVRWAAARELSTIGDPVLPPLLRALINQPDSVWLREGTHYVLKHLRNSIAHKNSDRLLAALEGSTAVTYSVEEAAGLLLLELEHKE